MAVPEGVDIYHIFEVHSNNPTVLRKQLHDGEDVELEDLRFLKDNPKKGIKKTKDNWPQLFLEDLEPCVPPGLQYIKWLEVFKKWGKYCPPDKKCE